MSYDKVIPCRRITGVEFFVNGSLDNSNAYVMVTEPDGLKNNIPVPNGVYDAHMGPTSPEWLCQTCNNTNEDCPGHFGCISLNYPVQSPMFQEEIIRLLKILCHKCSELIIPESKIPLDIPKHKIVSEYVKATRSAKKNNVCPHCGFLQPKIVKEKQAQVAIWAEIYDQADSKLVKNKYQIFNHTIYTIFERISEATMSKLGKSYKSHPKNMILYILPVSPNTVRPDLKKAGSGRSNYDDITVMLKCIITVNKELPRIIPDVIPTELANRYNNLDLLVLEMIKGTPINKSVTKVVTSGNKPIKSLSMRIPGKAGRIRRNLMGKRVRYSGRVVISCDPTIAIDEISFPEELARLIQIDDVVTPANYQFLNMCFNNKRDAYPGCTSIQKANTGAIYRVGAPNKNDNIRLEYGDIVSRDIVDGDICMVNRQPSMLPYSMLALRAKISKTGKTAGLNILVCIFMNADFDGDQIHIHVATSAIARNEIECLANPAVNFISRGDAKPMIGLLQDSLMSLVYITSNDTTINRFSAMQLLGDLDIELKKDTYTGREIISMLLPPINYSSTGAFYNKALAAFVPYNKDDIYLSIVRGEIKSGIMEKTAFGQQKSNSLPHVIYSKYGARKAMDTTEKIQKLTLKYMHTKGMSLTLNDIYISKSDVYDKIKESVEQLLTKSWNITDKLREGKLIAPFDISLSAFYEKAQVEEALTIPDSILIEILKAMDIKNNTLYKIIQMGNKGSNANFLAMTGVVGSVKINGKRMADNFGVGRHTAYFTKFDPDPIGKGFVTGSYIKGISPIGMIYSAEEARVSVINKALSTSIPGTWSRDAIKNLEPLIVNNYRQVKNGKKIVQFLYGGNGFDTRELEKVYIPIVKLSDAELEKEYKSVPLDFGKKFNNENVKALLDREFMAIKKCRDQYRNNNMRMDYIYNAMIIVDNIYSPFNIKRMLDDILFDFPEHLERKEIFEPATICGMIDKFCDTFAYIYTNAARMVAKKRVSEVHSAATEQVIIYLRSYLNTKTLNKMGITVNMLHCIFDEIVRKTTLAFIAYGSAIGILISQILMEPWVQFIIDAHHRAGQTGTEEMGGASRIEEIFSAKNTSKLLNPRMSVYLKPEFDADRIKASKIANDIEYITVRKFILNIAIFFEEYGKPIHPDYKHEKEIIDKFSLYSIGTKPPKDLINWVMRFEINKQILILKDVDLETIILKIMKDMPHLYIVHSPENSEKVILRCYIRGTYFKKGSTIETSDIEALSQEILNIRVKGIQGIRSVSVVEKKKLHIDNNGTMDYKNVFSIQTYGSNIEGLSAVQDLDLNTIVSNSVIEVQEIYGVEAARNILVSEIKKVVPNMLDAHYELFADGLTFTGEFTGVSKTGVERRNESDILLRASYNFALNTLTSAAINNVKAKVDGISSNLMVGQIARTGTLYNRFSIDDDTENITKDITDILADL